MLRGGTGMRPCVHCYNCLAANFASALKVCLGSDLMASSTGKPHPPLSSMPARHCMFLCCTVGSSLALLASQVGQYMFPFYIPLPKNLAPSIFIEKPGPKDQPNQKWVVVAQLQDASVGLFSMPELHAKRSSA